MSRVELRPPLPTPLSHEGIRFVMPALAAAKLSEPEVAAIASALTALLPPGDFAVSPSGELVFSSSLTESFWHRAGLLEGIEREPTR